MELPLVHDNGIDIWLINHATCCERRCGDLNVNRTTLDERRFSIVPLILTVDM